MKKTYYFILFILIPLITFSQQQKVYRIAGVIIDSTDQKGIPYATMSIVKLPEESIEKQMAVQDDGKFDLSLTSTGEYLLTVRSLGYKPASRNFIINEDGVSDDLSTIPLNINSIELPLVTITADMPLVKVESDKLIYNVVSDFEAKTSDGLEILKKVPMLMVNSENKIQVNGNKRVKIFINGKASNIVTRNPGDFLQNMPASLINSIEVISNPGAKYDAEGTEAIINIVMEKKEIGYNCSLNNRVYFFDGYSIKNGLNFTTAFGKFGASINILNKSNPELIYDRTIYKENYIDENQKYTNWDGQVDHNWFMLLSSIDVSYDIDSLNLISLNFNSEYNKSENQYDNNVDIENSDNLLQYSYLHRSSNLNFEKDFVGNINYQNISKKDKRKIFTLSYQIDYLPIELRNEINIDSIKDYTSAKQISQNYEYWTERTFQTDYVFPLNDKSDVEAGAKYILREDKSNSQILDYEYSTSQFIENAGLNDDFSYRQNILAAYLTYNLKFKNLNLKLGLRTENSTVNCEFTSIDTADSKNSITELVPNISLGYQLNESQNLRFSYAEKIKRPSVWHINPYVDKSNPDNFYSGNPNIKTEHFHSFKLNYGNFGKFGNFNVSLAYRRSNDGIEREIKQINTETILTTYDNIAKIENFITSVSLMLKIGKKIRFQLNPSVNYNNLENINNNLSVEGWGYDISSNIDYRITKRLKFSASGYYHQIANSLQSKVSAIYSTNFALKKEFLQSKLIVSLLYNSSFKQYKSTNYELFDDTFYQITKDIRQGYSYGFKVSYNFGKLENGIKKVKRGIYNDDIKRK